MRKILLVAMLALAAQTARAQPTSLDSAISEAALELSLGLEAGARLAVASMEAGYAGMSSYLINGMVLAFSALGFIVADQNELDVFARELGLQTSMWIGDVTARSIGRYMGVGAVVTGALEPFGYSYLLRARIIDVETGAVLGHYAAHVQNNLLVALLLGPAGRRPGQAAAPGAPAAPVAPADADAETGADAAPAVVVVEQIVERCEECAARLAREITPVNWLSIEASFFGGGLRYERNTSRVSALGAVVFFDATMDFDTQAIGVLGTLRLFPGGIPLFLELGMGVGWMSWERDVRREFDSGMGWVDRWYERERTSSAGFMIAPGAGARLGGRTLASFVNPFISFPTLFFPGGIKPHVRFGAGVGLAQGNVGERLAQAGIAEPSPEDAPINWFSIEGAIAGGGLRFERNISPFFAAGVSAFYNLWFADFEDQIAGIMMTSRLFLRASVFYIEFGMGFGRALWSESRQVDRWDGANWVPHRHTETRSEMGFMIGPGIGLRLGGQTRASFANPFAKVPIMFGGGEVRAQLRLGVGFGLAR